MQLDNLGNRISEEIFDWKYSQLVLEYSHMHRIRINNAFNVITNVVAVISVISWWNFPYLKCLWALILLSISALRLTKNLFLTPDDHIINMLKTLNFYYYHIDELEYLYFDFNVYKREDLAIEEDLVKLMKKHADLVTNQIFKKPNLKEDLVIRFSRETDNFHKRLLKKSL